MNQGDSRHSSKEPADSDRTPITVYDPTYFAPESTETQKGPVLARTEPLEDRADAEPAALQERFAAFAADLLLFALTSYGLWVVIGALVKSPLSLWAWAAIFAGWHLIYYTASEILLSASPGKKLEGLEVRSSTGGRAGWAAIAIRNLARIIDYPLFFLAAGLIETTSRRQRLGDLSAGTEVTRRKSFDARRLAENTPLAGATRRAIAWALDLVFVIPLFYGFLLLAPVSRPALASAVTVAALPLTILSLTLCETFFQTTPGKALLGMKVAREDGRAPAFATVLLRNIFKLLDANPVGYLCALLSSRKQRPGDIAAGTSVFRDRNGLRGWWSLFAMGLLAAIVGRLGFVHKDSFLRQNADLKIGSIAFSPVPKAVRRLPFLHLGIVIEDLDMGLTDQDPNPGRVFIAGQSVYLQFRIAGYTVQDEKAWIQADVRVLDAQKNIVMDRPDAINSSLNVGQRSSARLISRFSLAPQSPPGSYTVQLTVRDMFVGRTAQETVAFTIR